MERPTFQCVALPQVVKEPGFAAPPPVDGLFRVRHHEEGPLALVSREELVHQRCERRPLGGRGVLELVQENVAHLPVKTVVELLGSPQGAAAGQRVNQVVEPEEALLLAKGLEACIVAGDEAPHCFHASLPPGTHQGREIGGQVLEGVHEIGTEGRTVVGRWVAREGVLPEGLADQRRRIPVPNGRFELRQGPGPAPGALQFVELEGSCGGHLVRVVVPPVFRNLGKPPHASFEAPEVQDCGIPLAVEAVDLLQDGKEVAMDGPVGPLPVNPANQFHQDAGILLAEHLLQRPGAESAPPGVVPYLPALREPQLQREGTDRTVHEGIQGMHLEAVESPHRVHQEGPEGFGGDGLRGDARGKGSGQFCRLPVEAGVGPVEGGLGQSQ